MRVAFHRFLRWFPLWALGTCVSFGGLAIAAAQVWPGAKAWDEAQRNKVLAAMSEPTFWFLAVIVVALWGYATWHTRPTRKPRYAGWDARSIEGLGRVATGSNSVDRANRLAAMHQLVPPANKRGRDCNLAEALGWIVHGEWGKPFVGIPIAPILGGPTPNANTILRQVAQKAVDGNLTMWGKADGDELIKQIPSHHWEDHALGLPDLFGSSSSGGYRNIMLSKAEVEREWPHEG